MPLDARAKRFLDVLAAANPASALSLSVAERRAALAELMRCGGPAPTIGAVADLHIPGPAGPIRARRYEPFSTPPGVLPGIVYFHGGGLVAGSLDTHDGIARALTATAGCRVVSVDYRLAPEAPFPAALDDAVAAVRHCFLHHAELGLSERIAVCGDSAGATLAAAACQALRRDPEASPHAQVLLCPILDYAGQTASRLERASGYLLDEATLQHDLRHYLPRDADPADPRVSPLRAATLPTEMATVLHTAEFDPLHDEGEAYARRLREAGATVAYTCHPGMIHLFYGLGAVIPYARTALTQLGVDIAAALAAPAVGRTLAPVR
jgi:acetyl esterase/lipase